MMQIQVPSKNSRWESIPTQQNPRFPRNIHRAKREAPKLARRRSSPTKALTESIASSLFQVDHERLDRDQPVGNATRQRKLSLLDGINTKIRFNRKGQPIIILRRSTTRTSCSDITFDSAFFSEDDDCDLDGDADTYVSEEASLVDDDDDDDDQEVPEATEEIDYDDDIPRILVLALEPYSNNVPVHPTRIIAHQISKDFGPDHTRAKKVAVETVAILTDSQADDDTRDDRYILTMAALEKHIQRTMPEAIVVVTEDSSTSHLTVEAGTEAAKILQELKDHDIPSDAQSTYGPEVCRQWIDRFHRAGLSKKDSATPVVFLHIPPYLPETAVYHYHPSMEPETSVKGIGLAISCLVSQVVG